jgi:hypothetical protein
LRRQIQLREGRNAGWDHSHDDGITAALLEDVHAEPRMLWQAVGQVARAMFFEGRDGSLVLADQLGGNAGCVIGGQQRQGLEPDRDELAVAFHLRRPARRKDQVAHPIHALHHPRHQTGGRGGLGGFGYRRVPIIQ